LLKGAEKSALWIGLEWQFVPDLCWRWGFGWNGA